VPHSPDHVSEGATRDLVSRINTVGLSALVLTISFFASCERPTSIRIEGGTTPVFILSGTGRLESLAVYSPDYAAKAQVPFDEKLVLWEIKPIAGDWNGTPVEDLKRITYGIVPQGYMQVTPRVGYAPLLREGSEYFYSFVTTGAPWASGYVEIRNSQAVPTDGPRPCFTMRDGKWLRVTCSR
jgi:hypothetical protein